MAEPKPEYFYAVRADNDKLKATAEAAGVPIKFDREVGTYALKSEGMSKDDIKAAKAAMSEYTGKTAKAAWTADRKVGLAEKENLRGEAKKRETTTKEPKPAKKTVKEEGILVYPSISQKDEYRRLVVETQSESRYQKAKGEESAHYVVKTTVPEKFAAFMGDEAKQRFQSEYAATLEAGTKPQSVNTAAERARDEARARSGGAFMAQYRERGFRLADKARDGANNQKQLNDMRDGTTSQLLSVLRTSRDLLTPLRDKEAQMRADAAGVSVEQVKAMSWAEQKQIVDKDGKPVGLVGDEFRAATQLARGIGAIEAELQGRGVGAKKEEPAKEQGQAQGQTAAKGTKAQSKSVSAEASAENELEVMAAMSRRGRGNGR